jgi:hypothetical protein
VLPPDDNRLTVIVGHAAAVSDQLCAATAVAIAAPAQWAPGVQGVDVLVTTVLSTLVLTSFVFPPLVYYAYRRQINWPLQGGSRVRIFPPAKRRTIPLLRILTSCRCRLRGLRSTVAGSNIMMRMKRAQVGVVVIGAAGLAALVGIAAGTADGEHADIAEAMGLHSGAITHARASQVKSGLSQLTTFRMALID